MSRPALVPQRPWVPSGAQRLLAPGTSAFGCPFGPASRYLSQRADAVRDETRLVPRAAGTSTDGDRLVPHRRGATETWGGRPGRGGAGPSLRETCHARCSPAMFCSPFSDNRLAVCAPGMGPLAASHSDAPGPTQTTVDQPRSSPPDCPFGPASRYLSQRAGMNSVLPARETIVRIPRQAGLATLSACALEATILAPRRAGPTTLSASSSEATILSPRQAGPATISRGGLAAAEWDAARGPMPHAQTRDPSSDMPHRPSASSMWHGRSRVARDPLRRREAAPPHSPQPRAEARATPGAPRPSRSPQPRAEARAPQAGSHPSRTSPRTDAHADARADARATPDARAPSQGQH